MEELDPPELGEEAVDLEAVEQAATDAEKFPELQTTDGEVIQEEGVDGQA